MAADRMHESASSCPLCAAPLVGDQRYCLNCGLRVAPHRVALPAPVVRTMAPVTKGPARRSRRRPHPRTAAALVLATVGVGTVIGSAAPGATGARPPLLALAPAATPVATATPAPPSGAGLADDDGAAPAPVSPPSPAPAPARPRLAPAARAAATPQPTPVATATPEPTPEPTPVPDGPPAKHVVVVSLTGHDASAFAWDSPSPYLAHELPVQGALLRGYRTTATPEALGEGLAALAGELADAARSWKAYVDEPAPCATTPADRYDPARNPFTGRPECATSEGPVSDLEADFSDTDLAPSLAYVVPDTCHDAREADCPGEAPSGLERADAWLREWIPRITGSKAFADDGLLVVLFDGGGLPQPAPDAGPPAVGALVISRFARARWQTDAPYDHLSLLRTIAGTFGVAPPGEAAGDEVVPFGHDVLRSQDVLNSDTKR